MAPSSRSSPGTGRRRTPGWRSALTLQRHSRWAIALAFSAAGALVAMTLTAVVSAPGASARPGGSTAAQNRGQPPPNALVSQGQQTFRFDTFGDESFWGDTLHLNQAIAGANNGGVGPGLSPKQALALGLKVDVDALPASVQQGILDGTVNLDDPATTLALLKLNAVVGVKGFFDSNGKLNSVGIECALCHSTVDNSLAQGIGHRLDGWANRDLNVGAIVGLAPNLQPIATLLHTDVPTVHKVLDAWGPGKFDAELFLDGKGFQPNGQSAATLIPPAFGLAGINLHTWTGWGSVTHWNAFVANLEMHGKGTFFDPRLDNASQFPVAASHNFGHVTSDDDRITKKLPALHFYQLALAAPAPPAGSLDEAAVERGDELFSGKAKCASCHTDGLYSEPGWNMHTGGEIGIDNFQADRAPDHRYRTSPLKGLWTHTKGGFFHDGQFATLLDVVNHYNGFFNLGLTDNEKSDLIKYLLSLGDVPFVGRRPSGDDDDQGEDDDGQHARLDLPLTSLRGVGPKPTRGPAEISFTMGTSGPMQLGVFDVRGRMVADLAGDRMFPAGAQSVRWDGRESGGGLAPPGI